MGSPPGPVAGGAPRVWRASPVHRLCHAVAPRHSHRVVELAQRMRLPPRCRHPPFTHARLQSKVGWKLGEPAL